MTTMNRTAGTSLLDGDRSYTSWLTFDSNMPRFVICRITSEVGVLLPTTVVTAGPNLPIQRDSPRARSKEWSSHVVERFIKSMSRFSSDARACP